MTPSINRRSLITGLVSLIAAPPIVRVSNLMPVKSYSEYELTMRDWTIATPEQILEDIRMSLQIVTGIPQKYLFGCFGEVEAGQ